MEVDRRSLMKGMLAGGALWPWDSSLGLRESPPRRPNQCLLLLGGPARTICSRAAHGPLTGHGI